MKAKSAIAKGKELENWVADQIIEKGLDAKAQRSHGSGNGNREKSDIWTSLMILGQNAGFECKNHKTLAIPAWWKQAKKLESLGREPVLVFKLPYEPLSESKVVIYLDTLLELIKASKEPSETVKEVVLQAEDREKRWAAENAKSAITKLLKTLEN